jgi:hypothetical protein
MAKKNRKYDSMLQMKSTRSAREKYSKDRRKEKKRL